MQGWIFIPCCRTDCVVFSAPGRPVENLSLLLVADYVALRRFRCGAWYVILVSGLNVSYTVGRSVKKVRAI